MKLEFDREAVMRRYREAETRNMERLARQVLEDCEEFIPLDEGALKRSGRAWTEPGGGGRVGWDAPHARTLYRGELLVGERSGSAWAAAGERKVPAGRPLRYSTDKNPQAQKEWFEAAKKKHGSWTALAARLFGGGV